MNLRRPNANEATGTFNRSRNVAPISGICTRCIDGCRGGCETWLASFRGREVLYPGPFGEMTAGADKNYPLDYSHLNIQGYAVGAYGLPDGVEPNPDTALFPNVDTQTEYVWSKKVKMQLPIFTGALGSTDIARNNWEQFAVGAAISGITLVCGENVCGVDPKLVLGTDNKVQKSPEMDRRINTYKRFHEGFGEILVQMAFKAGAIKEFERHSRLGFVTREGFLDEVDRLRDLGFKRVTLKTGAWLSLPWPYVTVQRRRD